MAPKKPKRPAVGHRRPCAFTCMWARRGHRKPDGECQMTRLAYGDAASGERPVYTTCDNCGRALCVECLERVADKLDTFADRAVAHDVLHAMHHSIEASARQRARQTWRSFGAHTEEEAYGYWVQQFRRLMGVTIVREFARLRIRRVPFLGVPREFVRDRGRGRRVVQEVPAHGRHAGDFFGHQGRMFHR